MHTLIVYCHPYPQSFGHAQLEAICRKLERENHDYKVIDLYEDGFNPVLSREELKVYFKGEVVDPMVKRYQEMLLSAEHLVMIFPIWWSDIPAMLKGWIDKVMLVGSTWYLNDEGRLIGKLSNIKDLAVYTTSAGPTIDTIEECGDAIRACLIDGTMWQLNIGGCIEAGKKDLQDVAVWHNFGMVGLGKQEDREAYLRKLEGLEE